tara:strand:+ start:231 stop:440 length:210 start_codon:yes stop_codon:yes gene_type:complete
MTSEQQITTSQKSAFKSFFLVVGILAIAASSYTLSVDGFAIENTAGLFSGITLILMGIRIGRYKPNKKG